MTASTQGIAAAIPLAIAIIGGSIALPDDTVHGGRFRVAAPAIYEPLRGLGADENQLRWVEEHNPFELPKADVPGHRTLIVRQGYTLAHNNVDLIADWVTFHLTEDYVAGDEERPGSSAFKPDPWLPKGRRAETSDYQGWNGVFDRGHQVANKDSVGRGKTVVRESFYLSNMTPQASKLNRAPWRVLEARIQDLAKKRGEIWVATGPLFVDDDGDGLVEHLVIGSNQVSVPTHYFKIVLAKKIEDASEFEAISFIIPNKKIATDFREYLVSIDEIERLSGFDFFRGLDDFQEQKLESSIAKEIWDHKTS